MTTIITRLLGATAKGSPLTNAEVDNNFINLNTDKVEVNGTTPVAITANSTTNALRITQVGTGNALLVEDSANPDATPTVIDNSGRVLVGVDASRTLATSYIPNLQIEGTTFIASSQSLTLNLNNPASPSLWFAKSRGSTNGSNDIVSVNDALGIIVFNGADGTDIQSFLETIDDSTSQIKGTFKLTSKDNPEVYAFFNITGAHLSLIHI